MANPVLCLLEGNGSLAGRDRAGAFTATGSGALRYAAANGARINYFPNPGLGSNSTSWSDVGSAVGTRTADTDFVSGQCWSSVATASTSDGFNIVAQMRNVSLSAATLTVGVSTKLTSGASDWQVRAQLVDAAGSTIGSAGSYVDLVPAATVSRSVLTITNPTQAGGMGVQLQFRRKTAAASTIRAGDVTVESGSTAGTWFSPVWLDPITGVLGTANASPSVSRATFWIEEATTNLFRNPVANSATTDAAVTAGFTLSRSTTTAYFGSASFKVDTDGTAAKRVVFETPHSLGYTGSTRTFIGSVYLRGTSNVYIDLAVVYTDLSVTTTSNVTLTLTDAWQRLVSPSLTIDSAKTVDYLVMSVRLNGAQSAATYYCNAVQIEEKAYATSYCDGTLGTGYSWSGTAHASTSSRTAGQVSASSTSRLSAARGAVCSRHRLDYGSGGSQYVFYHNNGGADRIYHYRDNSNRLTLGLGSSAVVIVSSTLADDTWSNGSIDWDGSVGRMFKDGTQLGTATAYSSLSTLVATFNVGSVGSTQAINGYLGPVVIYDRPLTAAERAKVNAAIDSNGAASLWTVLGSNAYRNFQLRPVSQ